MERLIKDPVVKGERIANRTRSRGEGLGWDLKDESDWIKVNAPAIISEELWEHCNRVLESIKSKNKGRKKTKPGLSLFAGFVRCQWGLVTYRISGLAGRERKWKMMKEAFKYLYKYHEMKVLDGKHSSFETNHKYRIKCLIPTRFYMQNYTWTGTNTAEGTEIISELDDFGKPLQRLHGPVICENRSRTLLVDLGRTFDVGDEGEVHVRHFLHDHEGTFKRHLAFTSQKGQGKGELVVSLPIGAHSNVTLQIVNEENESTTRSTKMQPSHEGDGYATYRWVVNSKDQKDNISFGIYWQ